MSLQESESPRRTMIPQAAFIRRKRTFETAPARILLSNRFPKCFMPHAQPKFPLMIGIAEAVFKAAPDLTNRGSIRRAIGNYVGGRTYLSACTEGAIRIDLNGEAAGAVTVAEATWAAMRLERLNDRYKGF